MSDPKPKAPLVGKDFSGPKDNKPRTSPLQSKESVQEEEVEESQQSDADEDESGKTEAEPKETPEETYRKRLVELDIKPEEANKILDDILFNEGYTEEVLIGGRLKVVFRTRKYRDLQRTMRNMDNEAPLSPGHTNDLIARYNTAASLAQYKDIKFDFPDPSTPGVTTEQIEEAFQKRFEFLNNLDEPIVARIIAKMSEFDRKIGAVMADGAPSDF